MPKKGIDLRGLTIEVVRPSDFSAGDWRTMAELDEYAVRHSFPRITAAEMQEAVGAEDLHEFVVSHASPNTQVGTRYPEGNNFSDTLFAVARDKNNTIHARVESSLNVIGRSDLTRKLKVASIVKNYVSLRWIVTEPQYQGRGIASTLVAASVDQHRHPRQTLSAYTWLAPQNLDRRGQKNPMPVSPIEGVMINVGMHPDTSLDPKPYYAEGPPRIGSDPIPARHYLGKVATTRKASHEWPDMAQALTSVRAPS